jgi:hypothetical protein
LSSSKTSGCVASQLMIAWTSRPSNSGWSICNTPPEKYSPRGSHVTTLYPAWRSVPTPTKPKVSTSQSSSTVPSRFVAPGMPNPEPTRIVGACFPGASPAAGMKWT